jgi:UDP-N-acetylmuramoyl-L-alanyl-D-glutamate--2,6-diaminopimelate ligase
VLTTPEATDLQALLATMVERRVGAAAMEVSSHALALGRVAGSHYDVAIFTNLSQDHLDFHASMDEYFAAKSELFTPKYARAGVVNVDDRRGRELAAQAPIPVTTFSAEGRRAADWRAVDVRSGADGSTFRVIGPPGRLERVDRGQDFTVLVDYAHKPGAVEALLTVMRDVTQGSLVVVLGCGGDRDRGKRRLMGSAAARLADVAILTNDNPRSEDPLAILAEMMAGAIEVPQKERAQVVVQPDRAAAISLAIASAGKGDVVIIAGKGHEHGQYIGGAVIPFDDREVAAEALLHRRAGEDATMAGGLAAGGWSAPGGNPPGAASKGAEDLNEPYPEDA